MVAAFSPTRAVMGQGQGGKLDFPTHDRLSYGLLVPNAIQSVIQPRSATVAVCVHCCFGFRLGIQSLEINRDAHMDRPAALRGWGCSRCAWVFNPVGPPIGENFDALMRNFTARRVGIRSLPRTSARNIRANSLQQKQWSIVLSTSPSTWFPLFQVKGGSANDRKQTKMGRRISSSSVGSSRSSGA